MIRLRKIRLVAICFCILFGISVKCSNLPQQKYSSDVIHVDYKNFVESLETWMSTKEKSKNKHILENMEKLQEEIVTNNDNVVRWLGSLRESVEFNARRFGDFEKLVKGSMEVMRSKIDGFDKIRREVNTFMERVTKENQLIRHTTEDLKIKFGQHKLMLGKMKEQLSACVTDIKVSPSEEYRKTEGHLSLDKMKKATTDAGDKGFFLTAVSTLNTNSNNFGIKRRAIYFRKRNAWIPLHA